MLRKIADRTVHRKVYRSALFISSTNYKFLYTIKRYFSFFVKNAGKFHFFDCQILTSVEIKGILCIQKALVSLFPGDVLHMKEVSL